MDFEKCFDSLEWTFLDRTLEYFGFGQNFRKWISILYTRAQSCVINNGFLSNRFEISRGVRQGDPLSPYLFLLAAEILASALKNHPDIKGITIDNTEYLLSQYADDAKITLDDNELSFDTCFEILDNFANCSGLRINYDKTVAVRLGANEDTRNLEDRGLIWHIRILGIDYDLDESDITFGNYTKYLKKFDTVLNSWSARNLTLFGRITVLKSLRSLNLYTYSQHCLIHLNRL